MAQLQLTQRKTAWQLEVFDPVFKTRMLIPPRFVSHESAQAAYNTAVEKLRRNGKFRERLLTHSSVMYSQAPSVIHASTEIPY
jgi:hypothetical protein